MNEFYRSPLRTYLTFGILSLVGLWCLQQLPISLFPNSQRPLMRVCVPTQMGPEAFLRAHGLRIEDRLRAIGSDNLRVERLSAKYEADKACFDLDFRWGDSSERALLETRAALSALSGALPAESRERAFASPRDQNSGFLALVFSSPRRAPEAVFAMLEPILTPKLLGIREASDASLTNPKQKQLIVELKPEAMAAYGLFPSAVAEAMEKGLESYGAGSLIVGSEALPVQFPRPSLGIEGFKRMPIAPVRGRTITLGDVATLDLTVPLDGVRSFKANGVPSLVLFSLPRPGANIVVMSEKGVAAAQSALERLPKDIRMERLVDPSEFILSAVKHVAKEVALAAFLAVFTLWLFVGSLKNVAMAAIEIPLSMVLAFILLKLNGVNLNLVSMAGLALSAGMNVDASVVVMENIFRRLKIAAETMPGTILSFEEKAKIVVEAVREVRGPVIAAAIASIVVFIPLAFTDALTYALLGDLAKAVAFSHGCSIFVALILVPTIRLQLLRKNSSEQAGEDLQSPVEPALAKIENFYLRNLEKFLRSGKAQMLAAVGLSGILLFLLTVVAPRIPREIVGRPSAEWLTVEITTRGNTENRQLDSQMDTIERKLLGVLPGAVSDTFSNVDSPNNGWLMAKLKDKREMEKALRLVESALPDTPLESHKIYAWNPAELAIPEVPDFRASVRGSTPEVHAAALKILAYELQESRIFQRVRTDPETTTREGIFVRPKIDLWSQLGAAGAFASMEELADLTRVAIGPRYVTKFEHGGREVEAYLRYPDGFLSSPEELGALPIGVGGRIVPLQAIAAIERGPAPAAILRVDSREAAFVEAILPRGSKVSYFEAQRLGREAVTRAEAQFAELAKDFSAPEPSVTLENPNDELNQALRQLLIAAGISVLLVLTTMAFHFGNLGSALVLLTASPLGLIGAVIALFIFQSTISLNSLLGVILLNGIAVANGIMLLEFMNRAIDRGLSPLEAALETGRHRLRPILMTSMATMLGMIPIAAGFGEGGKVLQPLGITVAVGIAFSTLATIFVIPALNLHLQKGRAPETK